MVINFGSNLLTTTLIAISSTLMLTSELGFSQTPPITNSVTTSFHCIRQGPGYATVARRANRTTSPIITWQDKSFGPKFTPEERCKLVSERLTRAFESRAGRAGTIQVTHGMYNNIPVICYIKTQKEKCDDKNLILTLKPSERGQEKEILSKLFNFKSSEPPLIRGENTSIKLGSELDKIFKDDNATQPVTP